MGKCSMPWLPFGLRDKFEQAFQDLCIQHDLDYYNARCKLCSDWAFVVSIGRRGHWWLVPFVFIAVNVPWVWAWWIFNFIKTKGRHK